jgi:lysozyme family protein
MCAAEVWKKSQGVKFSGISRKNLMAKFGIAIKTVLAHEGGYVWSGADPGGETHYGISARSFPHIDIKNLTEHDAKEIYLERFWIPGKYEELEFQPIATKVFDLAVNMGPSAAHKIFQRAISHVGTKVAVDGVMGGETISAANELNYPKLLKEIRSLAAERYARIALRRPASVKYLKGWMRRAVA